MAQHTPGQLPVLMQGESLADISHLNDLFGCKDPTFTLRFEERKEVTARIAVDDDTLLSCEGPGEFVEEHEYELECESCHVRVYFDKDTPHLEWV
jgi:hypothetical protein